MTTSNSEDFVLSVRIHAVPGAKRTQVMGAYGAHGANARQEGAETALRLRIAAQPIEGRANEAIVDWLAATFGLRRAQVTLATGQTGRSKRFTLHFASAAQVAAAQALWENLLAGV